MKSKNKLSEEYLKRIFTELEKFKSEDRIIVLISHSFLELLINILIKHKCKNHKKILNSQEFSYAIKIILLNECKILDDRIFKKLNIFRDIRNNAAHDPLFIFPLDKINDLIFEEMPRDKSILRICERLVLYVWNTHSDVFKQYL